MPYDGWLGVVEVDGNDGKREGEDSDLGDPDSVVRVVGILLGIVAAKR